MKRLVPLFLLLVSVLLIPSFSFAFGGPAPEVENLTNEATSPGTAEAPSPKVTISIPVTPETKVVLPAVTREVKTGNELYKVRVGLFSKKEAAVSMMNKLKGDGYAAFLINQAGLWRVQVGAYRERAGAEDVAAALKAKGYVVNIVATD